MYNHNRVYKCTLYSTKSGKIHPIYLETIRIMSCTMYSYSSSEQVSILRNNNFGWSSNSLLNFIVFILSRL